jgi:hypothetical protein
MLSGSRRLTPLELVQDRYVVELPPASAALLTLR